jgi:lysophospholipase L1-like esterase
MKNKRWLPFAAIFLLVFTIAFAWGVFAVSARAFPYHQIAALQRRLAGAPDPPSAHDSYWYERTSFFDAVKTTSSVVMVGDSLTGGAEWRELFPEVGIANRGIDGDTTGGVLDRLSGIVSVHAGKIFIMIGINDFADTEKSVEAVFGNYTKIVAALKPGGAQVFVQSTLLCNERKAAWKSCAAANAKIKLLNEKLAAPGHGEFTFIDINRKLADEGGLKSELTYDGVHLNGNGYLLWRDEIAPFVLAGQKP